MSQTQSQDISIQIQDPLIKPNRSSLGEFRNILSTYNHEIRAIGGYWKANMRIADNQQQLEDWIQNGIFRHIVSYNPSQEIIFEGFVNKIAVVEGPLRFTIGPLINIGNEVRTTYSIVDNSTTPPTVGLRTTTSASTNTDSQTKFGVFERILAIGGATETTAEQIRDVWLAETNLPVTSINTNTSNDSQPGVVLDILGYWHLFKRYTYNSTNVNEEDLDAKLLAVLAQSPNSAIFSSDVTKITANTTQVARFDNDFRKAETVLKELNSKGDSSLNRYNIGVYANRRLEYAQAPEAIEYTMRLTGNEGVSSAQGSIEKPWNIRPGRWLFVPDFLTGLTAPVTLAQLKKDPRAAYIETIKFSAPNTVSINGVKFGEIDQLLARHGLQGVGS